MMKRIGLVLLLLSVSGLSIATTLKIATVTPVGSQWMKDMRATAKVIKERTEGRVVIKYYGGGSQGGDEMVLRRISIGSLQGGAFTPSALMEKFGDIGLYGLPMVFESEAEVAFVRSRMDEKIQAGLEEIGFVSFGFATTGFAVIMSNEPVRSLADLKGKRVWVPEGDGISKASMLALSVSPVPMPLTDVYTSLQTGGLDIIFMSSIGAVILQYHTKLKYLTDLPLVYTMGFMVVDKKAFNKISADDRAIVREVMSGLYDKYDIENMVNDREAKEALFNAGLQRIVPDEESIAEIRAVLHESNYKLANQGVVSLQLYEEMMRYVDEYRSEHDSNVVTGEAGEQVSVVGD